ncbi:MAG TPA: hypothetical protein VK736_01210 [Candidatus Binatia bacterium]|nr:hypothetical protein [Candidatus Binatia bacterium]
MRRLTAAFATAAACLAFGVGPAAAKVPYFSVELTPPAPSAGEPVTIVVRLWNDPAHTNPADWAPPEEVMDDMVSFRSEDAMVRVDLAQAEDGSYRGTVTLPAGSWTMVPFPDGVELGEPIPGFQAPIALTVTAASPSMLPLVVGATAAAIAAIAVFLGRRRRRSHRTRQIRQPA